MHGSVLGAKQTMDGPRSNPARSRPRGPTRPGPRSKLYERYDVELVAPLSTANDGRGGSCWRSWFTQDGDAPPRDIGELSNAELCRLIVAQRMSTKSRWLALAALVFLAATTLRDDGDHHAPSFAREGRAMDPDPRAREYVMKEGMGSTKAMERPAYMDPDSHQRNNPFAPEGSMTVMTGQLEVKRIGGRKGPPPPPPHAKQQQGRQEGQDQKMNGNETATNGTLVADVPARGRGRGGQQRPRQRANRPRPRRPAGNER